MKRAIEFAPGDVIVHSKGHSIHESTWVRGEDGWWHSGDVKHEDRIAQMWLRGNFGELIFSAARRQPAMTLPTEPTLGTVTWKYDDSTHVQQETALWDRTADGTCFRSESSSIPVSFVIAFEPIRTLSDDESAVPTSALNELRAGLVRERHEVSQCGRNKVVVDAFLAAVDAANGGAA